MSPILMRPIREQFEHDRVIRLLQTRFRKSKKKYVVGANVGDEETAAVRVGARTFHPDLVLMSADRRRVLGVVEVETSESVNNLEAMAQWAHFGKARPPFYLYVPAGAADIARRLCEDHQAAVTEIWTYYAVGQQMRFTMAYRAALPARAERPSRARKTAPRKTAARKTAASKAKRATASPRTKRRAVKR